MAANPMTRTLGAILSLVLVGQSVAHKGIDPESLWSPSLSQAEFQHCVEALEFSNDSEEAIFNVLYVNLINDYRQHSNLVKQRLNELEADQAAYRAANPDILSDLAGNVLENQDTLFAWKTLRKELDAQFDRDVRSLLTIKQKKIWIRSIQSSRRRRVLPEVRQLGLIRYSADLVLIIETINLPPPGRDEINPILSEYIGALDEAVRIWESEADVLQAQIMAIAYGPKSTERQQQLRRQIENLAATISDLNLRYAARIESQLSSHASQQFVEEINKIKYPELFLPSPVDLAISLFGETNQVSAEHREGADAIYKAYLLERTEIRRRIIKGVYQWEHSRKRELEKRKIDYNQYIQDGLDPYQAYEGHPAMEWLEKRHALAKITCKQLRSLFADDEFESLPLPLRLLLSW